MKFTWIAASTVLLASTSIAVSDNQAEEAAEGPSTSPNLNVKVSTSFPSSEIFGIKLVNGQPTKAVISVTNNEPEPVRVLYIGGSLLSDRYGGSGYQIIKNLSASKLDVEIPAGQDESISYNFATDLQPQDLRLSLAAVLTDSKGTNAYTAQAFNETVSVVEPDMSLFDPQIIFLYLFLLGAFGGTCYFIYSTWITTLFPQKRRGGKGGERAKRSSGGSKKVDPADQVSVLGADGPAVASGAQAYDASWIPEGHLNRPEAKRVKSGQRPKSRKGAE